ncbi:MAG: hypothetical protein AAGF24_13495, partial [Cyanobacteria bacterium P01_H01_bin.121]
MSAAALILPLCERPWLPGDNLRGTPLDGQQTYAIVPPEHSMSCTGEGILATRSPNVAFILPLVISLGLATPVIAQSVTPEASSTGTEVNKVNGIYTITGGATSADGTNLFHSFTTFGLNADETANFAIGSAGLRNVL